MREEQVIQPSDSAKCIGTEDLNTGTSFPQIFCLLGLVVLISQ